MCIGATPWPGWLYHRFEERMVAAGHSGIMAVLTVAAGAAIWLMCLAYLVDATYNPFLYFRF